MRLAGGKYLRERVHEIVVGRVVGPEGEDAAGMKFFGENAEAFGAVECGVTFVEEVLRGVIDIEQDSMKAADLTPSNYALYGVDMIGRVKKIQEMKRERYTLAEIRKLLERE